MLYINISFHWRRGRLTSTQILCSIVTVVQAQVRLMIVSMMCVVVIDEMIARIADIRQDIPVWIKTNPSVFTSGVSTSRSRTSFLQTDLDCGWRFLTSTKRAFWRSRSSGKSEICCFFGRDHRKKSIDCRWHSNGGRLACPFFSSTSLLEKPFNHDKAATSRNHLPNPLHSSTSHRPNFNISTLKTISNFLHWQHFPTIDLGDDNLIDFKRSCYLCDITCMEWFQELSSCASCRGRSSTTDFRL